MKIHQKYEKVESTFFPLHEYKKSYLLSNKGNVCDGSFVTYISFLVQKIFAMTRVSLRLNFLFDIKDNVLRNVDFV